MSPCVQVYKTCAIFVDRLVWMFQFCIYMCMNGCTVLSRSCLYFINLETVFLYLCTKQNPGILALIIIRTLRRDIARYNKDEEMVRLSSVVFCCIQYASILDNSDIIQNVSSCVPVFACLHHILLILPCHRMILWKRLAGNLFMEMCLDHPDIQPWWLSVLDLVYRYCAWS